MPNLLRRSQGGKLSSQLTLTCPYFTLPFCSSCSEAFHSGVVGRQGPENSSFAMQSTSCPGVTAIALRQPATDVSNVLQDVTSYCFVCSKLLQIIHGYDSWIHGVKCVYCGYDTFLFLYACTRVCLSISWRRCQCLLKA